MNADQYLKVLVEVGFGLEMKYHGLQFLYGLVLGGVTQPVEILNVLFEERPHIFQHLEGPLTVGIAIEHRFLIVEEYRLSLCSHSSIYVKVILSETKHRFAKICTGIVSQIGLQRGGVVLV